MFATRRLLRPVWQTAWRTYSSEAPASLKKKRSVLGRLGKGLVGVVVGVPTVGGAYYVTCDDLKKRQLRVTVQGVGRFFRWVGWFIIDLFGFFLEY